MSMTDKAVSTEDLCAESQKPSALLGVARLEAILHTLVENKVEALKNDNRRVVSVHSSSRNIFNRLKLISTANKSKKIPEGETPNDPKRIKLKSRQQHVIDVRKFKRPALKQEVSISSPESQQYQCRVRSFDISSNSDDDRNRSMHYDHIYIDNSCCSSLADRPTCCCNTDINGQVTHFDDDYISLKIDGYGETDAIMTEDALRRARRKRRRRRKRRMKKRLAMHHAHLGDPIEIHESFKNLTEDELSRRAKWTIVATACLLLFMCLLLVGITLRMAPIIDEMVRKENEEFINSLNRSRNSSTTSVHGNVT